MSHSIKTVYVVHHSHTDIGYTDTQERIVMAQIQHIRDAVKMSQKPENAGFRWNCETLYCVEKFLENAPKAEIDSFLQLVKDGRMGISGTYLNFNDLVDSEVLNARTRKLFKDFKGSDIEIKTAMNADINGISMGQRDVLIENGVEFLFTNIHCHHGMYPLYQNQNAYWWESQEGKRLLVWNGEHYNLGNALSLTANPVVYYMERTYFGAERMSDTVDALNEKLEKYLTECEEAKYPYDFIITSVSGVFSDNAPPNETILRIIEGYQERYSEKNNIEIKMVSLQELYAAIKNKLVDLPVCRGDLNDWWANGVGSTPYAVKHYRAAIRTLHLAEKLNAETVKNNPDLLKAAEDNIMLYAEHTWGHSATITNPYDTLVTDLDLRKTSYASKANEAAVLLRDKAILDIGGKFNYYDTHGGMRAVNTSDAAQKMLVEFYIETSMTGGIKLFNDKGEEMKIQRSGHPRGVLISFIDFFKGNETKEYRYEEAEASSIARNSRYAYSGSEGVRDIINDFDSETYRLPYELENEFFHIRYEIGEGFTSFWNKRDNCEMLATSIAKIFTPIYERTELLHDVYTERSLLGRNIRGKHAKQYVGEMTNVECICAGDVFVKMKFTFKLEGTEHCDVIMKFFKDLPKVEFSLRVAKTLSEQIESVYMPITLKLPNRELWLKKGREAFRPGVDQIRGTNMEYWMTDIGAAYTTDNGSVYVRTCDVPLVYQGEMKHHPIKLCDGAEVNNTRDVYSWVMNNTWETNFKMDLSGYAEFLYTVELSDKKNPEACMNELLDTENGVFTYLFY